MPLSPRLMCATVVAAALLLGPAAARGQADTVYLVRHAEKASQTDPDSPLSEVGVARARALADSLAGAGVRRIVVSDRQRTAQTAAPLAARLGLTPEVVGLSSAHVADVAEAVRRGGGPVLVVGHSNTVPAIIAALGGSRMPDLCDASYDQLFVLEVRGSAAITERRRVGVPTPAGDRCAGMTP